MANAPRLLILDTSHRRGGVGLASGETLVGRQVLEEARRHTRDLVPAVRGLLAEQGWRARDLDGVLVGLGPGSYTGLRVGLMSAKMLAYASGCAVLGVPTFTALAAGVEADTVAILADAQQDKIYVQSFTRRADGSLASDSLGIVRFHDGLAALAPGTVVCGPGLEGKRDRVPAHLCIADEAAWLPDVAHVLRVGLARFLLGERDDPMALEPLYLRPSSAEEKWDRRT